MTDERNKDPQKVTEENEKDEDEEDEEVGGGKRMASRGKNTRCEHFRRNFARSDVFLHITGSLHCNGSLSLRRSSQRQNAAPPSPSTLN